MYTVNTLKKELCEAGILPDDTLLIHSSMKKSDLSRAGPIPCLML